MKDKKPTLLEKITIVLGILLLLASLCMGIHSIKIQKEIDSLSGYEEYLELQIKNNS